ncbi:hypothetical protein [Streptomyces adustus]|uniref:hypothetical protein n=1 Tax=Streptomyces adustus TaxID=1609272 RepID=UPI003722C308
MTGGIGTGRSVGLSRLLLTTAVLTAAGGVLLAPGWNTPAQQTPPAVASSTLATSFPAPQKSAVTTSTAAPRGSTAPASATASATATATATASAASPLPGPGENAAGDPAVQSTLDAAWPADLPEQDELWLLAAGRELVRADATGVGRERWPGVFPSAGRVLSPAFGTGRFRIRAAIARRDTSPNRAVVHVVWAGADRGGTFTDLRITDWYFTRTTSQKGVTSWTAQPCI